MARRKAAEVAGSQRTSVDWKYFLFYVHFYLWLILIALFGIIAET
jgi:hypothetical protein